VSRIGDWFEERLPVADTVRRNLDENVPGGARFTYALGSATLLTFLVLAITGVWQLMYYVPSISQAYDSVNFLRFQVPLGWLIHGLHFWAANAMVVLVLLHLGQVFIWGAYKKPRELTWLLGVALLVGTLLAVFTGGPLVWDEKGYWAARVGSGIAGGIPLLGPWLKLWVFGGETVGQLTLSRFFFLHIAIAPFIILAALALHMWAFRKGGAAGTWNPSTKTGKFWPRQVLMDLLVFTGVLTALVGLSAFLLTPVSGPADAIDASYLARPDWPFLFLFQLVKWVPSSMEWLGTVVIPGIGLILIIALPWLDRGPERSPAKRPIAIAAFAIIVGLLGFLTYAGAQAPAEVTPAKIAAPAATPASAVSTETPPAGPSVASVTVGGAEHGRTIFVSYCQSCHGQLGKGGVDNPNSADGTVPEINPIDPEIKGRTIATFIAQMDPYLQNGSVPESKPEGADPKLKMPSFGLSHTLTQQQIADVEAYVMSLNGVNVAVVANPGIPPKTFFWWTLAGFVLVVLVGGAALVTSKD
jgi:ubiquinol-cytochrome c reductase cytochrome b subunit